MLIHTRSCTHTQITLISVDGYAQHILQTLCCSYCSKNKMITRMELSRAHTSARATDATKTVTVNVGDWCGLRPSVLRQNRSETKKSVLVWVLVLQIWCCFVKHDLVTLVVIKILKDTATFKVLSISLFCAWNITTVEINSGVYLLKS